jgi:hypothetical protein
MVLIEQRALKPQLWNNQKRRVLRARWSELAFGSALKKAIGLIFNFDRNALEGDGIRF